MVTGQRVGDRVKKARKQLGYTQSELAEKAGLAQQTITKLEQYSISRPRRLEELSKALNCNPEWLLFGMHPPRWAIDEDPDDISTVLVPNKIRVTCSTRESYFSNQTLGYALAYSLDENAYGIKIEGDDEIQGYLDGSIAIAEPSAKIQNDDPIVLVKKDEKELILGLTISVDDNNIKYIDLKSRKIATNRKEDLQIMHVIGSVWRPNAFITA